MPYIDQKRTICSAPPAALRTYTQPPFLRMNYHPRPPLYAFCSSPLFVVGLVSSPGTDEPPEPNIWDWLRAARRAAFSIRSWSTSARHSSHRRFASSAEASAASSSCERDSNALTCLRVRNRVVSHVKKRERKEKKKRGSDERTDLYVHGTHAALCDSVRHVYSD